jgi:pilus assembly protein CpaE
MPNHADSRLSIALFVPDAPRRRSLALALAAAPRTAAREFANYPAPKDYAEFVRQNFDVAIIDLDTDIDLAIQAIESLCRSNPTATVFACSRRNDMMLLRRAMQAGARDFLSEPILADTMKEALARISFRQGEDRALGKLLVFAGSKAGVGTTSVATNFATALAKGSGARVAIVDLDLQGGDVALGLGLTATYSVADAFRNPTRLDRDFLSRILLRHHSGLSVLPAPEDFSSGKVGVEGGAGKLIQLLREEFDYVVIDSGSSHGQAQESLYDSADKLYLVAELSFPSLRNANRLISHLTSAGNGHNLDVILNKFDAPNSRIGEEDARRAMGRQVSWKIPNGHAAMTASWAKGVPAVTGSSPVTKAIVQMARDACGKSGEVPKQGGIFGFLDLRTRAAVQV